MKLEQQVTSLEISKRLKELGVKQNALFYWHVWDDESAGLQKMETEDLGDTHGNSVSAFTVAELGEMLNEVSDEAMDKLPEKFWWSEETKQRDFSKLFDANFWGEVMIYLLENKLITI